MFPDTATLPSSTDEPLVHSAPPEPGFGPRSVLRWEGALVIAFIATLIYGAVRSSEFLTSSTVFYFGINIGQIAIMALPMTLIILTGEIDLSVASMLGMGCSLFGYLFEHGVEIYLAMVIVLAVGAVGGALNGFLVTRLGLPSIAVTIGTLTMFRGIAEIILGSHEVSNFPLYLTKIGVRPIPGTKLSWSIGIFIVLAVAFAVVLHATPVGRSIFAIGLQEEAAFFSGIRVKRIKFTLFVLSGAICSMVGVLYALQSSSSRNDAGTGLELNVVAVVLFGGVSIFGGRGTLLGVALSVLVIGSFDESLTLLNVTQQSQNIVFGVLLLISVLLPNGADGVRRVRARAGRSRTASTRPLSGGQSPPPTTQHPTGATS
jgi:rhamnose transport system permease protein